MRVAVCNIAHEEHYDVFQVCDKIWGVFRSNPITYNKINETDIQLI